jgi:tetratricopeptide (TPR) repeat protein
MTDKQIENIKNTIKIFRSRLSGEKRRFGDYFDNGGIRYIIPELYIQIGDYKGALSYYRWFSREFPDDKGLPSFNLFCTLILYQNKRLKEAARLAYRTAFSNTYLIDLICNKTPPNIDKSELDGGESLIYAKEIIEGCNKLLTKDFKVWLCKLSETDEFRVT